MIASLYRDHLRPRAFALDAERAHELAARSLRAVHGRPGEPAGPRGVDRFGAHRGFTVRLQRATVRGFAVSGDLLLVLHSPQGGGCDLSILDLEERLVVAEHHENSTRACEERHVRALPRGFALAGFELPMGAFSVAFDCSRPPR